MPRRLSFEQTPSAFIGTVTGYNFGKMIVTNYNTAGFEKKWLE